jgi:predicted acyltransferase
MGSAAVPEAGIANAVSAAPVVPHRERLLSLDVFRGMTLAAMIVVNNHGDPRFAYSPLEHAKWHGWTPTDLIFPFFLFIVGMAIPYSLGRRLEREPHRTRLYSHLVIRSVVLFGIGIFMNGYTQFMDGGSRYHLSDIRIFGALQRIALCYFLASLIYLKIKSRGQALIVAAILALYFILLKFVPVPGMGAGILDREGNWCQFIDLHVMAGHLASPGWESKGLLSTFPALAGTLIGVLAGEYLRSAAPALEKVAKFFLAGNVGMVLGLVWSRWFPINQNLWTSSLVIFMSGMAMVIFASCYYLVDLKKITWWIKPFVIFGVNPLALWVVSGDNSSLANLEVVRLTLHNGAKISLKTVVYNWMSSWAGPLHASEIYAFAWMALWLGIFSILYRKRIFIKI